MSAQYVPDPQARLGYPWNVTALVSHSPPVLRDPKPVLILDLQSQRDVAIRVPINFVTAPGVSVTAACFAHNIFEADATARCLSNLLSVGFIRLIIDLYWDDRRAVWSLCPVQLPNTTSTAQSATSGSLSSGEESLSSSAPSATSPSQASITSNIQATETTAGTSPVSPVLQNRQMSVSRPLSELASTFSADASLSAYATQGLNSTLFSQSGSAPLPAEKLFARGPYTCSSSIDLSLVTSVLKSYYSNTDFTLDATLKYLVLNLHAARSIDDPTSSATAPSDADLPSSANLLGAVFTASLSSYMYTPSLLDAQRGNLNDSWQSSTILSQVKPVSAFYQTSTLSNDVVATSDGWPSESFMEFANEKRLVLEIGKIDPQMSNYSLDADRGSVFVPDTIDDYVDVELTTNATITSGCFFDAGDSSLAAGNASWALAVQSVGLDSLRQNSTADTRARDATSNLTGCGISPFLNQTLFNASADMDISPYKQFVYNSYWSWAPGQPESDANASTANNLHGNDQNVDNQDFRCALFNASNSGRWEVTFCQNRLPAACRAHKSPYSWTLTGQRGMYSSAFNNCPDNSTFAVPRNGLENRHLLAMVQQNKARDSSANDLAWINFNSLNVESCWVSGSNTTCPYTSPPHQNRGQVVVPVVAAVIIIFVALATLLVKCGSNRSKSKRRRKVHDGWDYEGVPS